MGVSTDIDDRLEKVELSLGSVVAGSVLFSFCPLFQLSSYIVRLKKIVFKTCSELTNLVLKGNIENIKSVGTFYLFTLRNTLGLLSISFCEDML